MRSTIVFLTLLVFISATKIDSFDSAFIEMTSDPRSEAVFATMAVQLTQSGGFDRVLALLNELVDDGRKQLHDATKLYKGTEARCDVSTMRFSERQNFYDNKNVQIQEAVAVASGELTYAQNTVKALGEGWNLMTAFLAAEQSRHAEEAQLFETRLKNAADAVKSSEDAIKAVDQWKTVAQKAFVQIKLEKVTQAYLEVKSFQLVIPNSFLELAASDDQVRTRLLEWLGSLRLTLLEAKNNIENLYKIRQELWATIESAVADLVKTYDTDSTGLKKDSAVFESALKALNSSLQTFKSLASQNSGLIDSNKTYCDNETSNFSKAQNALNEQIKLFRDIRSYFRNNYEKINGFVKDKYNTSSTK